MKTLMLLLGLLPAFVYALDTPVVDITATTDGDSVYVTLAWDPVPGAARYQVFRQDQLFSNSTLLSDNASSPFQTAVPTGWNWQAQPDILKFFKVVASDDPSVLPIEMINIPAGSFTMGQSSAWYDPEHLVYLTNDFLLGLTEITNQQFLYAAQWAVDNGYATVTNGNLMHYEQDLLFMTFSNCEIFFANNEFGLRIAPSAGIQNYDPTNHPVKCVTWYGAAAFCDWLSILEGRHPYYQGQWNQIPVPNNPYETDGYRLPTEAEWEYAARYNDNRTYPWGDSTPTCNLANFQPSEICVGWTSPVGTHPDGNSSLGIQDMAGNVYEFTNDWWASYPSSSQTNPVGPATGSLRITRGLCWSSPTVASAIRNNSNPSSGDGGTGFRICRTAQ